MFLVEVDIYHKSNSVAKLLYSSIATYTAPVQENNNRYLHSLQF